MKGDDRHFFPMTGRPKCKECGQPEGVILEVSATGFSVTSGFEHRPECSALCCAHGMPWSDDCPLCEDERAAQGGSGEDE